MSTIMCVCVCVVHTWMGRHVHHSGGVGGTAALSCGACAELGRLTGLTNYLRVSETSLNGTLPSELGRLTALESYFYLSFADFTGEHRVCWKGGRGCVGGTHTLCCVPRITRARRLLCGCFGFGFWCCCWGTNPGSIPTEFGGLTAMQSFFQLHNQHLVRACVRWTHCAHPSVAHAFVCACVCVVMTRVHHTPCACHRR